MSTRPGSSTFPCASMTSASLTLSASLTSSSVPMAVITPPSISTCTSSSPYGRTFFSRIFAIYFSSPASSVNSTAMRV